MAVDLIFAGVYLAGCALWLYWSARSQFGADRRQLVSIAQSADGDYSAHESSPHHRVELSRDAAAGDARRGPLWFRLPPILQDATFSCLLTFGFYFFFYLDQAHGWGYRYFHGACLFDSSLPLPASIDCQSCWANAATKLVLVSRHRC